MAMFITIEETLKQNSTEYQQHLTTRNRIARALQYQNNIISFKTIPKRFLPSTPEIVIPNTTLTNEFQTEYQQLFFQHLNKVITHNTITIGLENARLQEIITRTENQLSMLDAPTEVIAQLRHQFYTQNNILEALPVSHQQTNETIPPTPPSNSEHSSSPKHRNHPPKGSRRPHKRQRNCQPNTHTKKAKYSTASSVPGPPYQATNLALHNLSTYHLTPDDYELLHKGLSFSPTPNTPLKDQQQQMLLSFNDFASSLRLKFMRATRSSHKPHQEQMKPTHISTET